MAHNSLPLYRIVLNRANFSSADMRFHLIDVNCPRVERLLDANPSHPALAAPRAHYADARSAAALANVIRAYPGERTPRDEEFDDCVELLAERIFELENELADAELAAAEEDALADAEELQEELEKRG